MINTPKVAEILGLSSYQVVKLVKKGVIPTVNKPKKGLSKTRWQYDEAEIRFLAPNFQKGARLVEPIQKRVEAKLAEQPKKSTKKDKNILHRIESKLDRLLEIFE